MVSDKEQRQRRQQAERILRKAAQLSRRHFSNLGALEVEAKGLQDYVSAADREVEELIKTELAQTFAGESFLGEESGGDIDQALWVSDPIDGTHNFLRGIPLYGISLAFVVDARTVVGAIYLPELDQMYSATLEGAAMLNDDTTVVRQPRALNESLVVIGYNPSRADDTYFADLRGLLDAGCDIRRFGSATYGLCMVAGGRVDGFWQQHLQPWDAMAGLLIIERAGGRVNDFGAEGLRQGSVVLAAAPTIADELSRHLRIELKTSK
ncbi:MAG: inositol monophosphatase [Myxococcota bacterium]